MARGGHVGLVVGGEMPLADRVGGVAAGPQDLREEAVLAGDLAVVAGVPHGQVGDPAEAVAVVVAAGEQAGPGGRAQRGGVEVGEPEAVVGQAVDRRRGHVGSVTAQLGESHVVEHDEQDVGRALGRARHIRPPRGRVPPVVADHALEWLRLHPTSRCPRTRGQVIAPPRRRRDRGSSAEGGRPGSEGFEHPAPAGVLPGWWTTRCRASLAVGYERSERSRIARAAFLASYIAASAWRTSTIGIGVGVALRQGDAHAGLQRQIDTVHRDGALGDAVAYAAEHLFTLDSCARGRARRGTRRRRDWPTTSHGIGGEHQRHGRGRGWLRRRPRGRTGR